MSKLRIVLFVAIVFVCTAAQSAFAIPAFARMYGTSCSTCHIDFPKPVSYTHLTLPTILRV